MNGNHQIVFQLIDLVILSKIERLSFEVLVIIGFFLQLKSSACHKGRQRLFSAY